MDVKRTRVEKTTRSRRLAAAAGGVTLAMVGGLGAYATTTGFGENQVGQEYAEGMQISSSQLIKPIGERLWTPYGKIMGSTVSPDGRFLAATANDRSVSLQVYDLEKNELVWRGGKAAGVDLKLADNTVGQEGPVYSPDGTTLWMPNSDGFTRFTASPDGSLSAPTRIPVPVVDGKRALVAGMTWSADGSTLYAALNGQNRVIAIDPATGAVTQAWDAGIAPRQVLLVGSRLYVTDEGGRRARGGEDTQNSYGTPVPADPHLSTSTTGQVSVIDTEKPTAKVHAIPVGLHPTSMTEHEGALYVTNTNDDTVSVIDTAKDQVVQTIDTQPWKGSDVGYHPNAVTVRDGRLLVSLGRANALAVYSLGASALDPVSYVGLLPTDYYPEDVFEVGDRVVVANRRGIDARGPKITFNKGYGTTPATGYGTHGTTASLTWFSMPSDTEIRERWTPTVARQNGWGDPAADVARAEGKTAKAVPVPRRIGDPSTIKHVFMLVKENRTYDQVHGDQPEGNGDPELAQFGEEVTPNIHALSRQFGLYDNTYDTGTNSAEGHSWIMQGDNPEYTESSAGEYIRSYDTEDDVLGHQRSGFLWTSVMDAGHTAKNFGEFMKFENKPAGATWQQYYCASQAAEKGDTKPLYDPSIRLNTRSPIPSLDQISNHDAPMFDMQIPDLYRYQIWKQDFEQEGPADFNMIWLSDDHTGGPVSARSNVAGGDVAIGKIVETITRSKYWKDSAIFVVEDDSQNGPDHVDGHRAPIQVISPWATHGRTVSTHYTQISMVRTIQQILGAEPLNQKLAAAMPMFDAFSSKRDMSRFTALPNRVSLTENIAVPPACGLDDPVGPNTARSKAAPKEMASHSQAWERWAARQRLTGPYAQPDFANPEQMNRYTWYDAHHWDLPYPGDPKIYLPGEVPGAALPGSEVE